MAIAFLERLRTAPARRAPLTTSPAVRISAHDHGIVLLHGGTGAIFSANGTGARIWDALRRGDSLETIGAALARESGVDEQVAIGDAVAFAARLEREGMLVRNGAR